jgi:hypothetical protein
VSDTSIQTLVRANLPRLQELDLSLTGLTDQSLLTLEELVFNSPALVKLDISATNVSGDSWFTGLAIRDSPQVVALQELVFQFMPDMTLSSLQEFLNCPSFGRLQRLDVNWGQPIDKQTTVAAVSAALDTALARNIQQCC